MRAYAVLPTLLAACGLLAVPDPAEACGRRGVVYYATTTYCPPCPPHPVCCPPDETPLHPLPAHPVPHTTLRHAITLKNEGHTQSFVVVYIRYPDCVYRVYDKQLVRPHTSPTLDPHRYFAGDHLLVETWTRHTPHDAWHCHCRRLITLVGGVRDVRPGHVRLHAPLTSSTREPGLPGRLSDRGERFEAACNALVARAGLSRIT